MLIWCVNWIESVSSSWIILILKINIGKFLILFYGKRKTFHRKNGNSIKIHLCFQENLVNNLSMANKMCIFYSRNTEFCFHHMNRNVYSFRQTEARCHENSAHSFEQFWIRDVMRWLEERILINPIFYWAFCLLFHPRSMIWLRSTDGCVKAGHHHHPHSDCNETKEEEIKDNFFHILTWYTNTTKKF